MDQPRRSEVTPEFLQAKWDAIVIGSGLGGMTAAVGLAARGKKVLVLEQHYIPGGYATSFKRKGFTFETSLHCMPGLGEGGMIHRVLSELGVMDKITPIPLKETYAVRTPRGSLSMGADYLEQLKKMFPGESEAIGRVDKMIETLMAELGRVAPLTMLPGPLFTLLCRIAAPTIYRYTGKTLKEFLDEFIRSPFLKQLIAIQWGYYGLPLSRISAILYLLGWGGYLKDGIYYLKGTSQSLSNAFAERLKELGGTVLLRQRAEEITTEHGKVTGVISRTVKHEGTGECHHFRAPVVISNANPFDVHNKMLKGAEVPTALLDKMEKMEKSVSATCVYVGLDCPLSRLTKDEAHSAGFIDNEDIDYGEIFKERMEGKASGFDGYTDHGALDRDLAPPGKTSVVLIRCEFMTAWRGLSREEYLSRKAQATEEILAAMEKRVPGFREHIEVMETGTPLTMERYTSNPDGSFNGFAYTPERVGMINGGIPMQSEVKGLYHSNAWIGAFSGGFYGCILNGYAAVNTILHTADWRH
ncbi:MAG: NAD(P)/FAD-dependent oxidoreductase [Candidatus Eremiobacteraeota bacterium]|nr:NAD(P)/FAD-dependent oxidoreductase [Candidatus Eremiobacteraeota bacterium]